MSRLPASLQPSKRPPQRPQSARLMHEATTRPSLAGEGHLPSSRAQAIALRDTLDQALARPSVGPHERVQAWDSMTAKLATQVHSLSAERGDLLSGARDAYLQYIGRLEARLRERELAVVDQRLVRSERQRFEAEANLAQVCICICTCIAHAYAHAHAHAHALHVHVYIAHLAQVDEQEQRRSRVSQIEYANLDRATAAAHKPRPPKAPRQDASEGQAAPSRADRTSEATSVGSDAGSDVGSDAGSSAEPEPSKGLSAARELADGMDVDEKLKLAAELQDGMTPQELRQALVDIIERLAKGDKSGKMLGATLKQAMTTLHPREKFSLLQAALASFRPSEHERFLQTMVASWGSKRSDQIFAAYAMLGECKRL